jgi:hypothetical protein
MRLRCKTCGQDVEMADAIESAIERHMVELISATGCVRRWPDLTCPRL